MRIMYGKTVQARLFHPGLGRFVQPDTIIRNPWNPQAWNRYAYSINNPIRYIDPSGHMRQSHCVDDGLWCSGVGTSGGGSYTPPGPDYTPPSTSGGNNNGSGNRNGNNSSQRTNLEDIEENFGPTGNNWKNWACGVCVPNLDLIPSEMVGEPDILQLIIISSFAEPADWIITIGQCSESGGCGWGVYAFMLLPGAFGQIGNVTRRVDGLTGQWHHIFSTKIMRGLENHPNLSGIFERDSILVQAFDLMAHRGYQGWHRLYDNDVVRWLDVNPNATDVEFLEYLINYYSRPDMVERFPNAVDALNLALEAIK